MAVGLGEGRKYLYKECWILEGGSLSVGDGGDAAVILISCCATRYLLITVDLGLIAMFFFTHLFSSALNLPSFLSVLTLSLNLFRLDVPLNTKPSLATDSFLF